ncbi:HAMP domain-containing sensor histidine kinase [Clostridium coskatii]|uniref:histidine kinase n=1 Tax=Clostridium coskatii TaxID=1705578 RepID=A0A162JG92_9CLOT|nr:HAMP domain-containing sensor histidine kinase [Clostridium coskatii]OAA94675.1 Signal transduction histidine-protein kinase BaeS [Clostridium coskatii]OBR93419.1 signal transduction histidine-protein kinase BaeS [Clostridium coskatii]
MINKIKKLAFKSISREFLIINILSFVILIIGITSALSVIMQDTNNPQNIENASNDIYVQVNRYVQSTNTEVQSYINNLADENNVNIAITDTKGCIIFKSSEVEGKYIDLNNIKNIILTTTPRDGDVVYQVYNINISGTKYILVTWKGTGMYHNIFRYTSMILIPIIISLAVVYLVSYRKTRYIKYICNGIVKISHEDLNYRLEKKGTDELGTLADEINSMSLNLNNMINREKSVQKFKDELITNISHDLRTPLASLMGYLYLINDKNVSIEDKEVYSKKSMERAEKLKVLIENLFEYSKLESGAISLEICNVNIIEIIEQIIGELSIIASKSQISFVKKYSITKLNLNIDPYLISRVFQNILSNAIKYSVKNSEVYIDIVHNVNDTIISFQNLSSRELSSEDMNKIFDRFYMGDKSRNSHKNNSGLGLAIVKNIVDLHGGEVWAEENDNIFKMYIKLKNNSSKLTVSNGTDGINEQKKTGFTSKVNI